MTEKLKKATLSTIANLIHITTIKTVNSACSVVWGQDKEPHSLQRFKKVKS